MMVVHLMATIVNPGGGALTILWDASPDIGTIADDDQEDTSWTAPAQLPLPQQAVLTLMATNPVGTDSASVTLTVRAPVPAVPTGLGTMFLLDLSARLTWDVSPTADGYVVEWRPSGGVFTTVTTTDQHLDITNLTASTGYEFQVTATRDHARDSAASALHSFSTLSSSPAVPAGVQVAGTPTVTASVQWLTSALAESYIVEWRRTIDLVYSIAVAFSPSYLITNLAVSTDYEVRVTAVRSGYPNSAPSATIMFRTSMPTSLGPQGVADYRLIVDWEGDGTFGHALADVSDDMISVVALVGRDYGSQIYGRAISGKLTAQLTDTTGKYSRFDSTSQLFGLALPSRKVRLDMRIGGGSWESLWGGYLDTINPRPRRGGYAQIELQALGILSLLQEREITGIALQSDIATDTALVTICEDIGIPATDRDFESGLARMNQWWARSEKSLESSREVEETEAGYLHETKIGKLGFQNRNYRSVGARRTSIATFQEEAGASIVPYRSIRSDDPVKDVANIIRVEARQYHVDPEEVLWTLPVIEEGGMSIPIQVGDGQSEEIIAIYPNETSPNDHAGVFEWNDPVAMTDFTANSAADGSGTDLTAMVTVSLVKAATQTAITIENASGTNAYITKLEIRGRVLLEIEAITVEERDQDSIDTYGPRVYTTPASWLSTPNDAREYALVILGQLAQPQPKVNVTIDATHSDYTITAVQRLSQSDRVTLSAQGVSRLGFQYEVYIEAIKHEIVKASDHRVTYTVSPAASASGANVIQLGVGPALGVGQLSR